jgi:hypothetical protein
MCLTMPDMASATTRIGHQARLANATNQTLTKQTIIKRQKTGASQ